MKLKRTLVNYHKKRKYTSTEELHAALNIKGLGIRTFETLLSGKRDVEPKTLNKLASLLEVHEFEIVSILEEFKKKESFTNINFNGKEEDELDSRLSEPNPCKRIVKALDFIFEHLASFLASNYRLSPLKERLDSLERILPLLRKKEVIDTYDAEFILALYRSLDNKSRSSNGHFISFIGASFYGLLFAMDLVGRLMKNNHFPLLAAITDRSYSYQQFYHATTVAREAYERLQQISSYLKVSGFSPYPVSNYLNSCGNSSKELIYKKLNNLFNFIDTDWDDQLVHALRQHIRKETDISVLFATFEMPELTDKARNNAASVVLSPLVKGDLKRKTIAHMELMLSKESLGIHARRGIILAFLNQSSDKFKYSVDYLRELESNPDAKKEAIEESIKYYRTEEDTKKDYLERIEHFQTRDAFKIYPQKFLWEIWFLAQFKELLSAENISTIQKVIDQIEKSKTEFMNRQKPSERTELDIEYRRLISLTKNLFS